MNIGVIRTHPFHKLTFLRECFALCVLFACVFGLLWMRQISHKFRSDKSTMEHPFFIIRKCRLVALLFGFLGTGP